MIPYSVSSILSGNIRTNMKHWFTRKKPSEKVLHPQMTYDIFHNRKKFKIDLMDTLVYTWLPTKEYEMFVRDRRYQDK